MTDREGSNDAPTSEVFARIGDAIFALDDEWRFTYLNDGAERVLERTESDLLGEVIWDECPATVEEDFRTECERAIDTQETVSFETFYAPLQRWFEVRAYPSESGLSMVLRDSTDRVRREQKLQKRERALQRAYGVITDHDREFSEQIDALLNVVREAVGTDYATLSRVHGDEYVFEAVAAPRDADLRAGDSVPLEFTNCERVVTDEETLVLNDVEVDAPELADRSGNAEWGIACYLGVPVSVEGEVYGTFCFYDMEGKTPEFSDWDVTFVNLLSKWVSYELERERRNDRLESFASMVAHELRNPLHIAQLYHRRAADGDPDAAEEVATALDRIERLVDVILAIARGSDADTDRERVELRGIVGEAWSAVTGDDAELVVETDRVVETDPLHVRHLLENLFGNAVEHGGEEVTVRVGDLPSGLYVADDGSGISDEGTGRVFDAGYTTDDNGIGLGLAVVERLAESNGWDCAVTESEDGGARFEITGMEFASESDP
ncbi:GAF domain-containing protein [Halorussus gelatinilyticus]|uniref:histidine kinase n=1 Tax=Halorussus gelatinilyticus TaxID=2937524 RepID=A0A8U0IGF1_9EURY|nr:GAF domain-containing protein [Halorussus gelatinilyticus]UPV99755.1 GAF domain-containing protein [Halorussus gelatinilyticus]